MLTVTLNPVSRGSQATSVLEKKVLEKMSTPCSDDTQTVFLGHFSKSCACVVASDSLKAARSYNRASSFLLAFSSLKREKLNCVLAVPTPALEKLASEHLLPPPADLSAAGSGSLINILSRNK